MQRSAATRYERAGCLAFLYSAPEPLPVSDLLPRRRRSALARGIACVTALAALAAYAELPPAPVPLPRPSKAAGSGPARPGVRVLVALVRWQGGDAAYLRPAVQDATWRDVAAFWERETYGSQTLDITVTPLLESAKPMPGCAHADVMAEGLALARAAGFTSSYDRLVILSTPGCGMQWATMGTLMLGYTYVSNAGKAAHEMGHAFGLQHSRSSVAAENLYGIYGNAWEVMSGVWPELASWHFNAYDKFKLGVLTPRPCADAQLRPIEEFPDAVRCGNLWGELHHDGNVWVFKEEITPSNYGPADNTRVAILKPGETYAGFANAGGGRLKVKPP